MRRASAKARLTDSRTTLDGSGGAPARRPTRRSRRRSSARRARRRRGPCRRRGRARGTRSRSRRASRRGTRRGPRRGSPSRGRLIAPTAASTRRFSETTCRARRRRTGSSSDSTAVRPGVPQALHTEGPRGRGALGTPVAVASVGQGVADPGVDDQQHQAGLLDGELDRGGAPVGEVEQQRVARLRQHRHTSGPCHRSVRRRSRSPRGCRRWPAGGVLGGRRGRGRAPRPRRWPPSTPGPRSSTGPRPPARRSRPTRRSRGPRGRRRAGPARRPRRRPPTPRRDPRLPRPTRPSQAVSSWALVRLTVSSSRVVRETVVRWGRASGRQSPPL